MTNWTPRSKSRKANGVSDPAHFNYSMAAKSSRGRRDNLLKTIGELKDQNACCLAKLEDEEAELRKVEMLVEKEGGASAAPAPGRPAHAR